MIFDAKSRTLFSNLTKGYSSSIFQYVVAQELTMGRQDGRDITFSPDANFVAADSPERNFNPEFINPTSALAVVT